METTTVYWVYIGIMENGNYYSLLGLYWENGKEKWKVSIVYWGYTGIMEKKMETTTVYWGHIGIMEKKIETAIVYWGIYQDNGKENGS